jgi:hypothetical protein
MLQHRERFLFHYVQYMLNDDILNAKKLNKTTVSWLNNVFVINSSLVIFIVLKTFKFESWSPGRFRNREHITTGKCCSTKWIKIYLNAVSFLQPASDPDHIPYAT